MKIISWNVNGLRSVSSKGFPRWLEESGAEIVCVQEVKAQANTVPRDLFSESKYSFTANYAERPGYSGVGVYFRGKPTVVAAKLGHPRFDREGRMVRLDYPNATFIGLYMPNGSRDQHDMGYKLEAYEHLFRYLKHLKRKNVVLAGDLNIAHAEIDLARPKENKNSTMFTPEERERIDRLESLGFVDSFRALHGVGGQYSWWPYFANARARNLGWRIDYVFVSKALAPSIKDAFIMPGVMGSDHCPVGVEIYLR
jgi:exodeoxyribonuclease-3